MFCPSTYSNEMFDVFGKRFERSAIPFRRALGIVSENLVFKTIAQCLYPRVIVVLAREAASGPETDDVWNSRRSCSTTLLLRASNDQWRQ